MFPSSRSRRRLRSQLAKSALLAVVTLVPFAGIARAGDYHVFYCTTPSGKTASTSDWLRTISGDGQVESACPNYYIVRLGHGQHGSGEQSTAGFVAPSGTGITSITVDRLASILDTSTGDFNASPSFYSVYGDAGNMSGDGCSFFATSPWSGTAPCRGVAWPGYAPGSSIFQQNFANGTNRFTFVASCSGSGVCGEASVPAESRVSLLVRSVHAVVHDDNDPAAGSLTGSLTAGDVVRGTATLNYTASDIGAGVYESALVIDGSVVSRA
ncbi:MAG: hypothetical protein AAGC46_14950, partial [Solirubrobacteraceae bacterium]|nr:hypothetical protein [Patulibacter sp.]